MTTDDSVRHNIAANLQRILAARGWTQRDLARATGDAFTTISRIYNGRNLPLPGLLARIAEALDVSIDRLLAPPPSLGPPIVEHGDPPASKKIPNGIA